MIAYISGPITNNKNYKQKFAAAEQLLAERGLIVLNPATLPQGMPNNYYMPICLQMLNAADVIILLNDWDKSVGTNIECKFAQYQDKPIYPLEKFINIYDGRADESEAQQ